MSRIVERIAAALAQAEVGYSLSLTRLIDGVSTYTLTYDDGTPPLEFDYNDDAYAHIAAKKRAKAARLVLEAMREPTAEMLSAAAPFPLHLVIERNDVDYARNMEAATAADRMAARSQYQTMIDAALSPAVCAPIENKGGGQ